MWPIECAGPAASRVVIAACPLGLGTHELFPVDSPLWSRVARRLKHFRLADLDRPLEKLGTVMKLILQKQHRLMVLSPGLDEQALKTMFPQAQRFGDWPALRAALLALHGVGPLTVAVYRCAPFLIPAAANLKQEVGVPDASLTEPLTSA